jgi:hypothetical protein
VTLIGRNLFVFVVLLGYGKLAGKTKNKKCRCVGWGINGQEEKLSFERVCIV